MLFAVLLLGVACNVRAAMYYDSYKGVPITTADKLSHDTANSTYWCVNEIETCSPTEGRRVDGSCNNLKHPSRGASHTPGLRLLPAVYSANNEPKKTSSGRDMPNTRRLRTSLFASGRVPSQRFNLLAVDALLYFAADVISQHDTLNYMKSKTYCCLPEGKTDPECVPNLIPSDDPVHRFSGLRCLNMTRPRSFQSSGCLAQNTVFERILSATPCLDLSTLYGSNVTKLNETGRLFEGGLLKYEVEDGIIWPPSTTNKTNNFCNLNVLPRETRCHNMPEDGGNTLFGMNLFSIWFWRNHNFIALELAKVNPLWDDETLFNTARDINIAEYLHMNYEELLPVFLGRENLIRDGVISPSCDFRDLYDENVVPQIIMEYPYALRWGHTIQEGILKMYDTDGSYLKEVPVTNMTMRTGFLSIDNNIVYLTQGAFRQASGNVDHIVDPDIADRGLGDHQQVFDLLTNDLAKNRYFGFPPYIQYVELFFKKKIRTFSDLKDLIDPEIIEILSYLYEKVEDIDLGAGMWSEKSIKGGYVPSTFYKIVTYQLLRNLKADRHFYTRKDRPNAFNKAQLIEINKHTIARLLCDVGDQVTEIQPHAFLRAGFKNQYVSCDQIPRVNFEAWRV